MADNPDREAAGTVRASLPEGVAFVARMRQWAAELGFDALGVGGVDLSDAEPGLAAWLEAGFHGGMDYMARHGMKRARAQELLPGTVSVISVRMNYWPDAAPARDVLADTRRAYVSRYALGRDYHKVVRARLQKLADRIAQEVPHQYRVFTDSAPVLEVEHASRKGLGWRGKHTLLLDRAVGSWFFLGEIFTDLPLPADAPVEPHCGRCTACIDACPTQAIVAPFVVDARRCISYLTIELDGAIPEDLRRLMGNRIYGCDDCQLACPWNRFARLASEPDFAPGMASIAPAWSSSSRGARPSLQSAPQAVRSIASVMSAGCATLRLRWVMRRPQPRCVRRCARVRSTTARWCANMWHGRWRDTLRPLQARIRAPQAGPSRQESPWKIASSRSRPS